MAEDELQVVRLRNEFYRDGFYKVLIAFALILFSIAMLGGISFYLYIEKPAPVTFVTDKDWRAFPPVPLDKPYKKTPDLLQWVSDVMPSLFTYDFLNYKDELAPLKEYFTEDGWKKLGDLLKTYANIEVIQNAKLFVNGEADGAPVILNQGLLDGRYGWWVQMPIVIHYSNTDRHYDSSVVVQALVVRTSTLDNLSGIAIDNIMEVKPPPAEGNKGQQTAPGQPGAAQGPQGLQGAPVQTQPSTTTPAATTQEPGLDQGQEGQTTEPFP